MTCPAQETALSGSERGGAEGLDDTGDGDDEDDDEDDINLVFLLD